MIVVVGLLMSWKQNEWGGRQIHQGGMRVSLEIWHGQNNTKASKFNSQ